MFFRARTKKEGHDVEKILLTRFVRVPLKKSTDDERSLAPAQRVVSLKQPSEIFSHGYLYMAKFLNSFKR